MKLTFRLLGVALVAIFVVLLYACSGTKRTSTSFHGLLANCEDVIKAEITSPDHKWVITVYERNCGATAPYSTQINLRRSGITFNANTQEPVFVIGRKQELKVNWFGNKLINVRYRKPFDSKE